MDAVSLLRSGHSEVIARLHDLTRARARAQRLNAEGVLRAIDVQWRVEEELFYPALRARADRRTRLRVVEAIEEHRIVRDLLRQLEAHGPAGAWYEARLQLLREHVEHHVEKEEKIFAAARLLLGDDLADLGARMRARILELESGGPPLRDSPPSKRATAALRLAGGTGRAAAGQRRAGGRRRHGPESKS
jgi:hypothetical protein